MNVCTRCKTCGPYWHQIRERGNWCASQQSCSTATIERGAFKRVSIYANCMYEKEPSNFFQARTLTTGFNILHLILKALEEVKVQQICGCSVSEAETSGNVFGIPMHAMLTNNGYANCAIRGVLCTFALVLSIQKRERDHCLFQQEKIVHKAMEYEDQ